MVQGIDQIVCVITLSLALGPLWFHFWLGRFNGNLRAKLGLVLIQGAPLGPRGECSGLLLG